MTPHSDDRPPVCRRIAQLRTEIEGPRGKSRFAKTLGISASTYDYYENSRVPPAEVLVSIADRTGVDLRWLITGEAAPAVPSEVAGHPAIQRAARLLGDVPHAGRALAAFVDLLARVVEVFPADGLADGLDEGRCHQEDDPPQGVTQAPSNKKDTPKSTEADRRETLSQLAHALKGELARQADRSAIAQEQAGREAPASAGWVPVLGRTAAGVPHFWADEGEGEGLTDLGELVARHTGLAPLAVRAVRATPEPASLGSGRASLVVVPAAAEGEPVEFVASEGLRAAYPRAFAVRVDGNSMAPDLQHGDLVILSPDEPASAGKLAVVQLAGQIGVTCKLYRPAGGQVHLVSLNAEHPPVNAPANSVVWALRVLARVQVGKEGQGR